MDRNYTVQVEYPFELFRTFASHKQCVQYCDALRRSYPDIHITVNGVDW